MNKLIDWHFAWQILPSLLEASVYTIGITLVAFALALVGGLLLALARRSRRRWMSVPAASLIEFIRSTPLLIQIFVIFYVLPEYGVTLSALAAGTLGLALHYSCYLSEVYRGGLNSVPRGQWEAAKALSLSRQRIYMSVVLPQMIRTILPALGNYMIAMFKETPVLSAITVVELMLQAKNIGSASFRYLEPITMAGLFFLLLSISAAAVVRKLEVRFRLP
ncbi:MAG: ectoine/hydroxyectoine ABC transporter permease subunit EhuD [Gemmatimonadota bacterium]